ncbi:MAG: hypothetical protein IKI08_07165 [Selenomonadaceae bacterium]|nr:hypothetical protein [Selenomonadaceae bacterium]MBR7025768.1 hypothetical protein [Selenomonadaceae bacterium]
MANIKTRVTTLERDIDKVIAKLDMFITESRESRKRQDAEFRELRQKQENAQAKHDADMKEMQKNIYAKMDNMDMKIDSMGQHVRNMTIATAIGYAAMVVAVFLK